MDCPKKYGNQLCPLHIGGALNLSVTYFTPRTHYLAISKISSENSEAMI